MHELKTKPEYFRIRMLTPVHIGCGKELDPFHYVIRAGRLHVISYARFLGSLNEDDRNKFTQLLSGNSTLELREFVADRIDPDRNALYAVSVDERFARKYEKELSRLNNRLAIQAFSRAGLAQRATIPGSSLKGAIRTAVLNGRAAGQRIPTPRGRGGAKILEAILLNSRSPKSEKFDISRDPFRTLTVSDVPLPIDATTVGEIVNFKPGRDSKIPIQVEMTKATFPHKKEVVAPVRLAFSRTMDRHLKRPPSLSELLQTCNTFSRQLLAFERDRFYHEPRFRQVMNGLQEVADRLNPESQLLIRVGRFTQAESKTIEGHRDIKINPRKPVFGTEGTTRNITADDIPMGWCLMEKISEDEYRDMVRTIHEEDRRRLQFWAEQEASVIEQLADVAREEEQRRAEERKRLEEQRRLREAEEQLRKEREKKLAAMSREDQWIYRLPEMTRDETMQEVYPALMAIADEDKRKEVAIALKARWQALNCWSGKKLTDKQKKKVKQVRAIIGEEE